MPGNFRKEDLRIIKSYNGLMTALPKLLERRNFRQLTVNDLCGESQLSRTAFYTHFQDKYDLLKYWLKNLKIELMSSGYEYIELEQKINQYIRENTKIIRNVLEDADSETLDLIHDFVIAIIDLPATNNEKQEQKYIAMSNFCAGGIVNCLLWQIKKGFPSDIQMMNPDFYTILNTLLEKEVNRKNKPSKNVN